LSGKPRNQNRTCWAVLFHETVGEDPLGHNPCYRGGVNRRDLWRQLAARPKNVRFEEVEHLLLLSGWTLERTRGSHKHYRKGPDRVSVPYRRGTILIPYVRDVLRRTQEEGDD
jgi:predicted RNA binding protein YcfA (HicA-like mRNA interferase family)